MTATEINPSYQESKRRFRWLVRLAVFTVLVTITLFTAWYCSPRFRARIYLGLYLISPAKTRVWALEEIEKTENTIDGRITRDLVVDAKILALDDSNVDIRVQALFDLSHMGPLPEVPIDAITPLLDNPKFREDSVRFLGHQGSRAKEAVPKLMSLLSSLDERLRLTVVISLGEIGPDSVSAVPQLIQILEASGPEWYEKEEVATTLGKIGPGAASALPVILRDLNKLDDKDLDHYGESYFEALILSLAGIGAPADSTVPVLINILKKSDGSKAQVTLMTLGQFEKGVTPAIPVIVSKLSSEFLCEVALISLERIGAEALPSLREAEQSSDQFLRKNAREAIRRIKLKIQEKR